MSRVLAAAATLLTAIVGLSLTTASAATLSLTTAPAPFFMEAAACAPGTVNGTPVIQATATPPGSGGSYNEVSLSNIPAACQGEDLPLEVFVHTTTGTLFYSGSSTVVGSTASVTVGQGNYTGAAVTAVIVRINGWLFPTVWTPPAPPPPPIGCVGLNSDGSPNNSPCQLSRLASHTWDEAGHTFTNFKFSATTAAPLWQVTLDLSSSAHGFTGISPVRWVGSYQNAALSPGYSCSSLPIITIREANPSWSSDQAEIVFTNRPSGVPGGTVLCSTP